VADALAVRDRDGNVLGTLSTGSVNTRSVSTAGFMRMSWYDLIER